MKLALIGAGGLAAILGLTSLFGGGSKEKKYTWNVGFDKEKITGQLDKDQLVYRAQGFADPFDLKLKLELVQRKDGNYEMRTHIVYHGEEQPIYDADGKLLIQPPEKAFQLGLKNCLQRYLGDKQLSEIIKEDQDFEQDYKKWVKSSK